MPVIAGYRRARLPALSGYDAAVVMASDRRAEVEDVPGKVRARVSLPRQAMLMLLRPVGPAPGRIDDGKLLAWALCGLDVVLGSLCLVWPALFAKVFHPYLLTPQLDLIQRTGMLWLAYAAVAGLAATRGEQHRGRWFAAVGALRLIEVPTDLVYSMVATGAAWYSRLMLVGAPVINLAAGLFLLAVARELNRGRSFSQRR